MGHEVVVVRRSRSGVPLGSVVSARGGGGACGGRTVTGQPVTVPGWRSGHALAWRAPSPPSPPSPPARPILVCPAERPDATQAARTFQETNTPHDFLRLHQSISPGAACHMGNNRSQLAGCQPTPFTR